MPIYRQGKPPFKKVRRQLFRSVDCSTPGSFKITPSHIDPDIVYGMYDEWVEPWQYGQWAEVG